MLAMLPPHPPAFSPLPGTCRTFYSLSLANSCSSFRSQLQRHFLQEAFPASQREQVLLLMPSWHPCATFPVVSVRPLGCPSASTYHMLLEGKALITDCPGLAPAPPTEPETRYLLSENQKAQRSPPGTQPPRLCSPYRSPTHTESQDVRCLRAAPLQRM